VWWATCPNVPTCSSPRFVNWGTIDAAPAHNKPQRKINICSWRLYHFLVEKSRSPTNKYCKEFSNSISNRCCYHDTKDTLENTDFQQPDAFPDGNVAPSGTDDGFQ
jgi:hypothetical protein